MGESVEHHEGHIHLQITTGDLVQLMEEGEAPDVPANLGRIAYEAYRDSTGGVSLVNGDQLPQWEDLTDGVKSGWKCAGLAVAREIVE